MAIVYVRTVGFDLQNDVSESDHKLLGAKMLGACEKSSGAARSVCTAWCRNTFPLSERRRRRRRLHPRSGELLVVRPSKWTFLSDQRIFHITRRMVRRSFKATLIADIRGARWRAANEN